MKIISPYYLAPSEGPGCLITVVIFDGKSYDLCERAVRNALKAKNKLGFIEGTLKKPEPNGENTIKLQTWEMINSMICSWILNVIEPKLRSSIAYVDTAELMWSKLKKRYAVASAPKIHQLKATLANCKQGGMSVVEFYSKVMSLWSKLEGQIRHPQCTYKKCECDSGGQVTKLFEEEITHQFLLGLNDETYSNIRSQILAQEPLPSLDKIFNMVSQEENHKSLMFGREDKGENAAAFAVKTTGKNAQLTEKTTCRHCGRIGHEEARCFELIGYPAGWGTRGRGRGRGLSNRGGRYSDGGGRGAAANLVTTNATTSGVRVQLQFMDSHQSKFKGFSA